MRAALTFLLVCIFVISEAAPPPPPPAVYPFSDDFENYSPFAGSIIGAGWVETCQGTPMGFRAHGFPHGNPWPGLPDTIALSCNFADLLTCDSLAPRTRDSVITRFIGPLTGTSVVQFEYRIVDVLNYPQNGAQIGNDVFLRVSYSLTGTTPPPWNTLLTINSGSHLTSNAYVPVSIPMGQYASSSMYICLTVESGANGNFWVDIDNFNVGEPLITSVPDKKSTSYSLRNRQLSFSTLQPQSVRIVSLDGKVVLDQSVNPNQSVDLSTLPEGIYILHESTSQDSRATKFFLN